MSILHCRRVQTSDISALAVLQAARWETEEYWNRRIPAYLNGELNPQQALEPRVAFVALEDGVIVGFIAGHLTRRFACDGELEWITINPGRWGTGVSQQLFRLLAKWFAKQKAFRVCVDVDPRNTRARRFYAKLGAEELRPHWMAWADIRTALRQD